MKLAPRPIAASLILAGVFATSIVLERSGVSRNLPAPARGIDPKADEVLRKMSGTLKGLSHFAFDADHTTEVVLPSRQKLELAAASRVVVRRPNQLRSDRRGELADLALYYDGRSLTIMGKRANLYATAAAPPTLDQAIDFARDELGLEAPAADLLHSDPYRALTEDVVSGMYVGRAEIDGTPCHHLAFRGREVDWQIWIEDGPRALPRRYLITTKDQPGAPEFGVTLRNWSVDAPVPPETFTFNRPAGAERVDFLRLPSSSNGLKASPKAPPRTGEKTEGIR